MKRLVKVGALVLTALVLLGSSEKRAAGSNVQKKETPISSAFVSDDTWRSVERVTCLPTHLDACNGSGCQRKEVTANPPVMVVWKPKSSEYERCNADGRNCDIYSPTVSHSGLFTNVVLPRNANIFRITADGEYREISNIVDTTLIYSGICRIDR